MTMTPFQDNQLRLYASNDVDDSNVQYGKDAVKMAMAEIKDAVKMAMAEIDELRKQLDIVKTELYNRSDVWRSCRCGDPLCGGG